MQTFEQYLEAQVGPGHPAYQSQMARQSVLNGSVENAINYAKENVLSDIENQLSGIENQIYSRLRNMAEKADSKQLEKFAAALFRLHLRSSMSSWQGPLPMDHRP